MVPLRQRPFSVKSMPPKSPANLDGSYADYVFRVEPLQETLEMDTA